MRAREKEIQVQLALGTCKLKDITADDFRIHILNESTIKMIEYMILRGSYGEVSRWAMYKNAWYFTHIPNKFVSVDRLWDNAEYVDPNGKTVLTVKSVTKELEDEWCSINIESKRRYDIL